MTGRIVFCGAVLLAFASCRTESATDRDTKSNPDSVVSKDHPTIGFDIQVDDSFGAEGYAYHHRVTANGYEITQSSDRREDTLVVWQAEVTQPQREALRKLLRDTRWDQLDEIYEDPRVWDGLNLAIRITTDSSQTYKFFVANKHQSDLAALCDLLDQFVPDKYQIGYSLPFRAEQEATNDADAPGARGDVADDFNPFCPDSIRGPIQ